MRPTRPLAALFLILVWGSLWPPAVLAQETGTLRGLVRDPEGEPLTDARVSIPALGRGALTNLEGIFSLTRLPAGTHELLVSYIGYDTLRQTVTLTPGQTLTLSLRMKESSRQLAAIEVVGKRAGEIDLKNVDVAVQPITTAEIKLLPSLGTPDLAQYLQVLPGVVFTGDQGGQLFVRGGTPIQNLTLLDGAIIYNPFHTIGLFSVFDTDILRGVDVYSAGFGAENGGRVSSVMDIRTRNGNFQRYGGKVFANTLAGGLLLEGPVWKRKGSEQGIGSFLVSARECYLDQMSRPGGLYGGIPDSAGLPFRFRDLYGKLTLGSGANQISIFVFHQRDEVSYGFPSDYGWRSTGYGTNFIFLPPESQLIISGNVAVTNYLNEQTAADEAFPRTSLVGGFNSRINFAYIFNSINQLDYGVQLLGFRTDLEFTNGLGLITQQENFNTEMAGYAKYKYVFQSGGKVEGSKPFDRAVIEPSVRLHYYNDQGHVALEPRLRGKLNFRRFSLQGAVGWYTQNLISSNSDRDVVQLFQGFLTAPDDLPNPVLGHNLQAAWHALGGIQFELLPFLETTIEGWYKRFTQLTNINRERIFPEDPTFILEQGRSYGADLTLKYQREKLYLYATYSYMYSDRDDRRVVYQPVFDRRHTVNFVGSYRGGELKRRSDGKRLDSRWEVSTRWTFGSGFPFTQTQGFFEKLVFQGQGSQTDVGFLDGQLALLLSSDYNAGRLPAFHRLDASAKYRFRLLDRTILEFNVNAINLYNRPNIFYFDRTRFERVNQLPFMPTAGMSLQF